jgi:hypothetical protein
MSRLVLRRLAQMVAVGALFGASAAQADIITVTATGAVTSVSTAGGATTTLTSGTPLAVGFSFDSDALTTLFQSDDFIVYAIRVSNFSATLGSHIFQLDTGPSTPPVLILARGFQQFGGPVSQRSLRQQFIFAGSGGATVPFGFDGGARGDTLELNATFNLGTADVPSPTIALLRDPGGAARQTFGYVSANPDFTQDGQASGFASAAFGFGLAAVPEPGTWAMMILGFGLIGGAMRRRARGARPLASRAAV